MVDTALFVDNLLNDINFFAGVPDSLLKYFNYCITDKCKQSNNNFVTANEGAAVALATGYYLANKKAGLVYMQNSGLGNALNPLISLTDSFVYGIPMVLIIGMRGKLGEYDEPQHIKQGMVTEDLLKVLHIPFAYLPDNTEKAIDTMKWALKTTYQITSPTAVIVNKNTFSEYNNINQLNGYTLEREEAINTIIATLNKTKNYHIVSTTGMISRELYSLREKLNQNHEKDFLVVGSMGYASTISLGIALSKPHKKIVCLDGDGSFLMHMGNSAFAGVANVDNFIHIVLNNASHDSVGGQATIVDKVDLIGIAKACGYNFTYSCINQEILLLSLENAINQKGKVFIEVKVQKRTDSNLGRPSLTPKESKQLFMEHL